MKLLEAKCTCEWHFDEQEIDARAGEVDEPEGAARLVKGSLLVLSHDGSIMATCGRSVSLTLARKLLALERTKAKG